MNCVDNVNVDNNFNSPTIYRNLQEKQINTNDKKQNIVSDIYIKDNSR